MRRLSLLALLLVAVPLAAQEGPKSPEESLKCIKTRPGFTVELMAAEPLVMDPIAFAFGPDGKLWVVEMGDYPLGAGGKNKPGGRVKFLEKTKPGDGPYDKATLFLDNLGYPTGVTPWGKGVLVTCAPDIFYAEDTDGDGKADKKEVLYTGFHEGNQQHRVNGLVYGLDNWLYGANGDSGGKVKSIWTKKVVDIRGRDFRIDPYTGDIETVTGQTQFGRCRDDWGNWFGCNNSNPMFHFVLEDRYLRRNPHVLPPDPRVPVSVKPGAAPVYPISKTQPRFNNPESVNHFTSACSVIVYRDTLFGPAFEGNSFVSEPVHNLVHREVMKPKGVTFTSQRADDEQKSEFLASSDNWFRPTTIQTGPDGALWIADMYRHVIEHPEWIPKDWQKKLDLRAGHDKGRIYRVYPKDAKPRAIPRLDKMTPKELVACFESPNGWTRDMAQQILARMHYRGPMGDDEAGKKHKAAMAETYTMLHSLVTDGKSPQARLCALCTLDGMHKLRDPAAVVALSDQHPAVRKHAVRSFDTLVDDYVKDIWTWDKLSKVVKDSDPHVRMELAHVMGTGSSPEASGIVAGILCREDEDRYIVAAGLNSITQKNGKHVIADLSKQEKVPVAVALTILRLPRDYGEPRDFARLFIMYVAHLDAKAGPEQYHPLAEALDVLDKEGLTVEKLLTGTGQRLAQAVRERVNAIKTNARQTAVDGKARIGDRMVAVRLLYRDQETDKDDLKIMASLLTPQSPDDLQSAVIQSLDKRADVSCALLLLKVWKGYSPSVRTQVVDALLSRPLSTRMLINAIESKDIPASEIDTVRRQRLLEHKDAGIREAAAKVFAKSSSPDRNKVVLDYILRLPEKGDAKNGAKLFAKTCAACHKLGDVGQPVGPDLASVSDRTTNGLLTAIVDPNRNVEARYVNYLATLKDGRTLTGLIASETSTSIALVGADGKRHDLLRTEIDELTSTGKSVMPEGLEKDLPPPELADLLAFLRGSLPMPKRKEFPGNDPMTLRPGKDGVIRLPATAAAIYGPKLVFEKQYANLGYWSSAEDHAAWTLDLPQAMAVEVWLDYACDNGNAGNSFTIASGKSSVTRKVDGTGTWDDYRSVRVGRLVLAKGPNEVVMRPQGAVRGALIDLKEIRLVPVKGK